MDTADKLQLLNFSYITQLDEIVGLAFNPHDSEYLCHVGVKATQPTECYAVSSHIEQIANALNDYGNPNVKNNGIKGAIAAAKSLEEILRNDITLYKADGGPPTELPDAPDQLRGMLPGLLAHLRVLDMEKSKGAERTF